MKAHGKMRACGNAGLQFRVSRLGFRVRDKVRVSVRDRVGVRVSDGVRSSTFLERDVIYTSRAYATMQCPSVCPSLRLSVTEVHWRIIANLDFKFRSHFTVHCGRRAACSTAGCCKQHGCLRANHLAPC